MAIVVTPVPLGAVMKTALISFLFAKLASIFFVVIMLDRLNEDVTFGLASLISLAIFIVIHRAQAHGRWPSADLGRKPVHTFSWLAWALIAIIFGFVARLGASGIYIFVHGLFEPQAYQLHLADLQSGEAVDADLVLLAMAALVVSAAEEELVYRGFLLKSFSKRYGIVFAVALSSLIFGLIHFNWMAWIAAISLSILVLASGRLWPAIIAHAIANMVYPMWGRIHDEMSLPTFMAIYGLSACILVAVLLFWLSKMRQMKMAEISAPGSIYMRSRSDC